MEKKIGYCPMCDKEIFITTKASMIYCPSCSHRSADIVTEIFDKIDELLTKHAVMVSFQDGGSRLLFSRTLEIDLAELKNNLLGDI